MPTVVQTQVPDGGNALGIIASLLHSKRQLQLQEQQLGLQEEEFMMRRQIEQEEGPLRRRNLQASILARENENQAILNELGFAEERRAEEAAFARARTEALSAGNRRADESLQLERDRFEQSRGVLNEQLALAQEQRQSLPQQRRLIDQQLQEGKLRLSGLRREQSRLEAQKDVDFARAKMANYVIGLEAFRNASPAGRVAMRDAWLRDDQLKDIAQALPLEADDNDMQSLVNQSFRRIREGLSDEGRTEFDRLMIESVLTQGQSLAPTMGEDAQGRIVNQSPLQQFWQREILRQVVIPKVDAAAEAVGVTREPSMVPGLELPREPVFKKGQSQVFGSPDEAFEVTEKSPQRFFHDPAEISQRLDQAVKGRIPRRKINLGTVESFRGLSSFDVGVLRSVFKGAERVDSNSSKDQDRVFEEAMYLFFTSDPISTLQQVKVLRDSGKITSRQADYFETLNSMFGLIKENPNGPR